MISKEVETAVSISTVVLYRRVSTDQQVKSEYKNQLEVIKSAYPNFSIVNSTILSEEEPMSGRASPEKRMASGLGKCLKMLKRRPESILLVSDADRIARRADIFELIQRQGLGHRVFEAASGMSVNDIIATGKHHSIQAKTETDAAMRQAGMNRYRERGGYMGSPTIAMRSKTATAAKEQNTTKRRSEVFTVITDLVRVNRGRKPSYTEICDELDRRGVRTGQGHFFTPVRLAQYRKSNRTEWNSALDSYSRPRRRLNHIITTIQTETRRRRLSRRRVALLSQVALQPSHDQTRALSPDPLGAGQHGWRNPRQNVGVSSKGCRGPPNLSEAL
ncbi:recombinase family protein [Nioella ostreopsis]|uniref:recombinase family protein n=1 Tax=Nioella ostreopsis TaxID=2448479 RepID=UPI0013E06171|nr:recombinase family protein [Nioella ostreopsis]